MTGPQRSMEDGVPGAKSMKNVQEHVGEVYSGKRDPALIQGTNPCNLPSTQIPRTRSEIPVNITPSLSVYSPGRKHNLSLPLVQDGIVLTPRILDELLS